MGSGADSGSSSEDEFREVGEVVRDLKKENSKALSQHALQDSGGGGSKKEKKKQKSFKKEKKQKKEKQGGGGILKKLSSRGGSKKNDSGSSSSFKLKENQAGTQRGATVYNVVEDTDENEAVPRSSLSYDGVHHKFGKCVLALLFFAATLACCLLAKMGVVYYANRASPHLAAWNNNNNGTNYVPLGACKYGAGNDADSAYYSFVTAGDTDSDTSLRELQDKNASLTVDLTTVIDNPGCMTSHLWFALTLIPIAPLFLQFIVGCCLSAVREKFDIDDDPTVLHWQGKPAILQRKAVILIAFIESVFESGAIVVFMLFVLPYVDAISALGLLMAVAIGPVLTALVSNFTHQRATPGVNVGDPVIISILRLLVILMQIAGVVLIMAGLIAQDDRAEHLMWAIPLSVLVYSVSWWRLADRHLSKPLIRAMDKYHYSTAWIKAVFKVIFIGGISYMLGKYYFGLDPDSFLSTSSDSMLGPWRGVDSGYDLWAMGSAILFAFLAWIIGSEALRAALARVGFGLAVALATPAAMLWVTAGWCENVDDFIAIHATEDYGWPVVTSFSSTGEPQCEMGDMTLQLIGAIILWISWLLVSGLWVAIDHRNVNQMDKDLWSRVGYDGVFTDGALALNRNTAPQSTVLGSSRPGDHFTFIVATLYRESEREMRNIMLSIRNMNSRLSKNEKDRFRMFIMFDGALGSPDERVAKDFYPEGLNDYAIQFMDVLMEFAGGKEDRIKFYRRDDIDSQCLDFTFEHKLKDDDGKEQINRLLVTCVFKNTKVVKQRKRWSQILYASMIIEEICSSKRLLNRLDRNIYLLLLDGDTQFDKEAVDMMRELMERDPQRTGGVCGRIYPEGDSGPMSPIVMYQKFEYAVGHWMQKTAEHVFGTVMCSPGCFSMVRFSALIRKAGQGDFTKVGESAIEQYSIDAESAMDVLMYDQGEDRMLTTLLIKNGWMLQYAAAAKAVTFCPESFNDFFVQRRRWISSTLANLMQLMAWGPKIVKSNRSFSALFFLYCALILASSLLGPATVVMITQGGIAFAFGWSVETGIIIGFLVPAFYVFICYVFWYDVVTPDTGQTKQKKIEIQIRVALALTALYALWMCAVAVGITVNIVVDVAENGVPQSPDTYFLGTLALIFILTALMHNEFWSLLHGFLYLCLLPTMYLLLIIFAIANTHDQSWGTREAIGQDAAKQDIANLSWLDWFPKGLRWCFRRYYGEDKKAKAEAEEAAKELADVEAAAAAAKGDHVVVEAAGVHVRQPNFDAPAAPLDADHAVEDVPIRRSVGFAGVDDQSDSDDNAPMSSLAAKVMAKAEADRRQSLSVYAAAKQGRRQMWLDARVKDEDEFEKVRKSTRSLVKQGTKADVISAMINDETGGRGRTIMWADDKQGMELEDRSGVEDKAAREIARLQEAKKNRLKELGERLRSTLAPFEIPPEKKKQNAEDMAQLARIVSLMFLLISMAWLTLAFAVGLHSELQALDSNFLGLVFLIAFGVLILFQFLATVYHRWETLLHLVSMVPMKSTESDCSCVDPAVGNYVEVEVETGGTLDALTGKSRGKSIAFSSVPIGQSMYGSSSRQLTHRGKRDD